MDMNKSSDMLKDMINKSGKNPRDLLSMDKGELKKRLSGIDKNAAAKKLRSMGLGIVADKMMSMSDAELIDIISKNPSLLRKINDYLK